MSHINESYAISHMRWLIIYPLKDGIVCGLHPILKTQNYSCAPYLLLHCVDDGYLMPLGNDLNSLTPPCDDYFNWSSEMYSDTLQNQNHKKKQFNFGRAKRNPKIQFGHQKTPQMSGFWQKCFSIIQTDRYLTEMTSSWWDGYDVIELMVTS